MLGAEADEEGGCGKQSGQEIKEASGPRAVEVKEEEAEEADWHTGVCKWFNPSKGWGFINVTEKQAEGGELSEAEETKVCKSESATVEKSRDGKDEKPFEEAELPSGDIFVHQSTIQKEGFR